MTLDNLFLAHYSHTVSIFIRKERFMAKAHRGAGIRDQKSRGRGDCPVCKRTAIKVMYEQSLDGAKTMVCKQCNAALKHAK